MFIYYNQYLLMIKYVIQFYCNFIYIFKYFLFLMKKAVLNIQQE